MSVLILVIAVTAALTIGCFFFLASLRFRAALSQVDGLARALNDRLSQQEVLFNLTVNLPESEEPGELARNAISAMAAKIKAARCFLFAYDSGKNAFSMNYEWNDPGQFVPFYSAADAFFYCEELLLDTFVIKGDPVLILNNLHENPHSALSRLGCKSCAFAPVYVFNKIWAVIGMDHHAQGGFWTDESVNTLKQLAQAVGSLIMRAQNEKNESEARKNEGADDSQKLSFVSNISHEIRTPLNAIIGMALLARGAKTREAVDDCIGKITEASNHLLGVVNAIFDFSKLEANKMTLAKEDCDFRKMVRAAVSMCELAINAKSQNFVLEIDPEVPPAVICDEQLLSKVLINLLSNAVKFTPKGGDVRLAVVAAQNVGKLFAVRFTVADTGIGISEEQQKRLFAPFAQADESTTKNSAGTGLGLAISKKIVEAMGGKIWLESEAGKGACFIFELVLEEGDSSVVEADAEASDQGSIAGIFKGRRILVAEDIEINREIVQALLEETGIEIEFAEDGSSAVQMFQGAPEKYELILMDIHMPVMNGYDATGKIREAGGRGNNVPIIAMTADVFKEDIEKCFAAGMNYHLGKPIEFNLLVQHLKMCLLK